MNGLKTLMAICLTLIGAACQLDHYKSMMANINAGSHGWKAGLAADIDYDNPTELKNRLGAIITKPSSRLLAGGRRHSTNPVTPVTPVTPTTTNTTNSTTTKNTTTTNTTTPTTTTNTTATTTTTNTTTTTTASLDLRTKYPNCSSLTMIRNQGVCGACWAFSTMTSLSDRYCIANYNNGTPEQFFFSYENVMECCTNCYPDSGAPCSGGYVNTPFTYAMSTGVVSGEAYGEDTYCKPYYLNTAIYTASAATGFTCSKTCSASSVSYAPKTITSSTSGVGVAAMMAELDLRGTIVGSFSVYEDFYSYSSGVYYHVTGELLGGHAVRIIGYGTDATSGLDYWLIANSWGTSWGEDGYVLLRRGTNEGDIETNYYNAGVI